MAISPSLPGVSVCIVDSEKNPFEEYDDPEAQDEGPKLIDPTTNSKCSDGVRKFIECSTGQEFGIRMVIGDPYVFDCDTLHFDISIDGVPITTKLIFKRIGGLTLDLMGHKEQLTLKPFIFNLLNIGTESSTTLAPEYVSKLGIIKVTVWRGGPATRCQVQKSHKVALQTPLELHEKALKGSAKSHTASLGAVRQDKTPLTYFSSTPLDQIPKAEISFQYRSQEALKQLMIIPRTPEPSPEPNTPSVPDLATATPEPARDVKLEDFDEEGRRKVKEFMQSLATSSGISKTPTIKRERAHDHGLDSNSSKRAKMPSEPIYIDLSGD